jgi:hypothetical protein
MIFDLIELLALLSFAFACGYGVREWIARRRNAATRQRFYRENPELRELRGLRIK